MCANCATVSPSLISMNSTSRHHFIGSNIARLWQRAGLLAFAIFFTGIAHAQVTIGDPLIDGNNDGNSGGVYLYTGTFGQTGTVDTWSFFHDDINSRSVTPLLFQKLDDSTFLLTGVGTSVATNISGAQTGNPFGLIAGSAPWDRTIPSDSPIGMSATAAQEIH
jgi:hypothetical protein